jgi:hypothetical protein
LFNFDQFHHADPTDGPDAAEKVLMDPRNMELPIFENDEPLTIEVTTNSEGEKTEFKKIKTIWRFRELVREAWHILEQIHDHQNMVMDSPGMPLRFTDREKLEGFEFLDFVSERVLRPRVIILNPSGRGWVNFTRSIRAIALLHSYMFRIIVVTRFHPTAPPITRAFCSTRPTTCLPSTGSG